LPIGSAKDDLLGFHQYTDWMKGLLMFIPDGRYELKSFDTDDERKSVCAYGVFLGTHTANGGPCPPTGKSVRTDYVYVMDFDGEKIRHPVCGRASWMSKANGKRRRWVTPNPTRRLAGPTSRETILEAFRPLTGSLVATRLASLF